MLSEKDKYCIISIIWGIWKAKKERCIAKQKQTHRYRKQTSLYKEREERGKGCVSSIELRSTNYWYYVQNR